MKKKVVKKSNTTKPKKSKYNAEKEVMKPVGTYHDFLIYEKKDKIKEPNLVFENPQSDNQFINDFLILNNKNSKPQKSRFTELFKELTLNEKKDDNEKKGDKEKEEELNEIKEEPKREINEQETNLNIINNNNNINNNRLNSYDKCPSFLSVNSQYANPMFSTNNNNYNESLFSNNKMIFPNSNSNSRSTSFSTFKGHGGSFSNKSTNTNVTNYSNNTNNFYKTSSSNSIESNYMNNNMINLIYNNNINIVNNVNNNYMEKEFKEFEPLVDIKKVLSFEDKRTTIMIKNIPNKFTKEKLLEFIDKNFENSYDLFLLPKDGNKNRNFGYAFINFISSYSIPYFYFMFNGKKWTDTNSLKVCEITYSKIQGRNELISHYPNKIIFFNDNIDNKIGINNKFFIPNEYKDIFKQLYPNQKIIQNESGFIIENNFCY